MNIGTVRSSNGFMRTVSSIVLVTYSMLIMTPSVQAMQQAQSQSETREQIRAAERSDFSKALKGAKEQLRVLANRPDAFNRRPSLEGRRAAKETLRAWRAESRERMQQIRTEFADTGAMLEQKGLPQVIRQRHADALAQFESEASAFEHEVDEALTTSDSRVESEKAEAALQRLDRQNLGRSQQEFDPNNLPNDVLKPNRTRLPKTTPEAFQAALLTDNPSPQFAQASGFDFSQLSGASNPSYLGATTEVVLTDAIRAKAEQLHRNPVEIYNWVRNNVQWQPTWGAIQNASHTLSSQRGNAFDIASLTIALLRASGIPSRYVYGTIDVPEAEFRNWAGGFERLDAAMDFASAGGIPIGAVISGGRVSKARMEHVWVEVAVDFHPSRGTKNRSADAWIPLDPSYKQSQTLPGIDALQISGLDVRQLEAAFVGSGVVNTTEGWGTGFDPDILRAAQSRARDSLLAYIQQNQPNASAIEIVGGRRILARELPTLAASLPYRVVASGSNFAAIPSALQQQITFAFGKDIEGEPIGPRTFPWPALNNQQLSLSFRPATAEDASALRALLPSGNIEDALQFPTSIPAYLVRVVPELRAGETSLMQGTPMSLGSELTFVFNPRFVSAGEKAFSYSVPAGSYLGISVVAGSISTAETQATRARLLDAVARLQSGDPGQVSTLGRSRLLGDLFHAGVLGYYAQYLNSASLAGAKLQGHYALAAGLGSVGYEVEVDTFFGIPRSVKPGLIGLNIPIVNVVGRDSSLTSDRAAFARLLGTLSSVLESAVPQTLYTGSMYPGNAISAVKALAEASSSGQRVYATTSDDRSAPFSAYPVEAQQEISNALANGKNISVHSSAIGIPGWNGFGYIIEDPETGAGAYKISGGANGGMMGFLENVNDATRISRILFYLTGWIGEEAQRSLGAFGAFMGMLTGTASVLDDCIGVASSAQIGVLIAIQLMLSIGLTLVPGGFLFRLIINNIITEIVRTFMEALKYLAGCRNEF